MIFKEGIGEKKNEIREEIWKRIEWKGVEMENEENDENDLWIKRRKRRKEELVMKKEEEKIIE